jgi:uncharacterized surface protein with fasciclin (FAS1) repeats
MKKVKITMVTLIAFCISLTSSFAQTTSGNIVEIASGNPNFSTLVAAIKAAGLVETLSGKGPYTVFAPTNDAFAALPAGTLDNLLKPENKQQLISILTYHVVSGNIKSTDLKDGQKAKTVNGKDAKVSLKSGKAMVNDASVTQADITATNGVIHVIDKVIMPTTGM